MKKQSTEAPEIVEAVETIEATIETPTIEPKKSRLASALAYVQGRSKWVKLAVPALVVALGGYGYLQHGDKAGDYAPQAAMVSPYGQPQPYMPVAYNPNYGPAYGNYGRSDGYGHGNGHASGNFGFSMGGNMSGNGSGRGNGYGDGWSQNRYNNVNYY